MWYSPFWVTNLVGVALTYRVERTGGVAGNRIAIPDRGAPDDPSSDSLGPGERQLLRGSDLLAGTRPRGTSPSGRHQPGSDVRVQASGSAAFGRQRQTGCDPHELSRSTRLA